MNTPEELRYTKDHQWVRKDGDQIVVGLTDFAQDQLGDVVFVELPEVGATLTREESYGSVESGKTVSDLTAPMSGEVVEVNEGLEGEPELVNAEPYKGGWLIKVKPSDAGEHDQLMTAADYNKHAESLE